MFIDEVKIIVKAGHGGPGKVSFFAKKKGPSGGNGGKGADVYAVFDNNVSDLKKYIQQTYFKGEDGKSGGSNRKYGANAKNLKLHMPVGTTIIDLDTNYETELNQDNPQILLCSGGAGGLGNDVFKSPVNQTPRFAEPGKTGEERRFKLILKLIADYGLIGLPNAGKSSLLNVLTAANVKTAAYPFTTLEPNLGVIDGKVIADVPGLIEGASTGKGLGTKFLKHIEKVKLLLHCISVESENIEKDCQTITNELGSYNKNLLEKQSIILLTKIDLVNKDDLKNKIKQLKKLRQQIIPISIYDQDSLKKLKQTL